MDQQVDCDRLAPEVVKGIRLLPVVHDRLEMGAVARVVLEALQPAAVAVELPAPLKRSVLTAVDRLPKISLVISEEPGEEALVWLCSPGDPFAEALRWARARDLPVFLIDPDLRGGQPAADAVPDPYAIWELGPEDYLELLCESLQRRPSSSMERQRESGMAFRAQQARRQVQGTLLVLVGAAHARPLAQVLPDPTAQALARPRRSHQEVRHVHPRSLTGIFADPPLAHAAHELLRQGSLPEPVPIRDAISRRIPLERHGLRLLPGEEPEQGQRRRMNLARHAARRSVRRLSGQLFPDRRELARVIWSVACESYQEQTEEEIQPWQERIFFEFLRRHCRLQGLLAGGVFEWVVAARGVADDNLAWEVFDAARCYPWQESSAEIPTVEIDGDLLDLGTRKIRFRRRFFRVKRRPVPVRRRPETENTEEWLEGFDSPHICSYQPEDIVVEDYARYLQTRALALLSSEQKRTEPFSTSLLDGIDIRETLRNAPIQKIYVQEFGRLPGGAGSVVVIFDRDLTGRKFPHAMTWLGEHDQESDMAFYSTDPTQQVVGPGIMRATYGGLMMSYPPGRLYDVWQDPEYRRAREKAEVLLMSAIDYSREKLVVHLAASPPHETMRQRAARQGKRILHVPIGSVSPMTLKKIRVVHLLAGPDKRKIAADYIW